jgi:hypothetical protein
MNNSEFTRTMALLAAEHRTERAPVSVERQVLAEFDAARRKRGWILTAAAAGIAAGLAVGALRMGEKPAPPPVIVAAVAHRFDSPVPVMGRKPVQKMRPRKHPVAPRVADAEAPFVTIPYTVPLTPEENATVVRMTLSPSALALAGFPLPAINPGRGTEADVLVGEDGRARAIRLVNSSFR